MSPIPMRLIVGATVLSAAKHHCVTRVRPSTSDGISLPVFSAM